MNSNDFPSPSSSVISVVVPSRNEEKDIEDFLRRLEEEVPASQVIVADRSQDSTPEIVKDLAEEYGNIRLIEVKKPGKGAGLKKGFERAEGIIVMVDADGSYPASQIPRMIELLEDSDVVIGSRYCPGGNLEGVSLLREFTGKVYSFLFSLFFGVKDPQSGLKVFHKEVLEKTGKIKENGFQWDSVFMARARKAGLRITEHPITFTVKRKESNVSVVKTSWNMWITFLQLVLGVK